MSHSGLSSTFFPPPYRPDLDGPPLSVPDIAKQKLLSITQDCKFPDPIQEQQHLNLLTDSPGYAVFFLTSLDRYERLLNAKPVLIQGLFLFTDFTLYLHYTTRMRRGRPMESPCRRNAP